ncbi:ABC transporter ATP-binding protein [Halalkalibacter oceani]|uniref:ABC transporter ATP-binding protein n=1 Tax=Halalkalibacter oceani TaxID=1653776 RepID=A0A9X2IMB5_9BACI|nr:ABC transporter ATP-binding protein [Halalkalibacter oceani]MCM3712880.1 ABC transporter ATP-binding protein [Halalkalibacter oceani]
MTKVSQELLRLKELTFHYSDDLAPVIKQLTLSIDSGEILTVMAPSGTGKSTLFKLITGLAEPTSGSIELLQEGSARREIGYMPQQDLLFEWRTILDNVALPLELQGIGRKERYERARERMKTFGLAGTEQSYPHQLSGGMRQRANFLRATLSGERLLLLDEPFSSLDAMTRLSMQSWLLRQWEEATERPTLLFISHDVDEALYLSDRIAVFSGSPLSNYTLFTVPFSRPRSHEQLLEAEGASLKREILRHLTKEVTPS